MRTCGRCLFMLGGGESLCPEISLQEGEAGASSGPAAGRSAWVHGGLEKTPGTQRGTKKDVKNER